MIFRAKHMVLIGILVFLCFLSVFVFTLPSFLIRFNLTETSNIGSTIGGITAPVLGVVSSVLLYLALTKQIESNQNTQSKNESDIIFLLFSQFDKEYDRFYYDYNKGTEAFRFTGMEGIHKFVNDLAFNWTLTDYEYADMFAARQFSLLINSFKLIEWRIQTSTLDSSIKQQFQQTLQVMYQGKLEKEFDVMLERLHTLGKKDHLIEELEQFQKKYKSKYSVKSHFSI